MGNRRLSKAIKKFSNQKQEQVLPIAGTLGLPIGGQKLVEVPNRNGFVYVKLRDNQSEVIQAYNSEVSNIYGLAVLVMRQGNIYKVIGRDQDRYRDWGNIPYLPRHGGQHSFNQALGMGADVTWIYSQQMMPLLGYPSGSLGSNGITVAPYLIRGLDGGWKYVGNTGTPDISMYRPTIATGAVMVLVYLDTVSGNPYLLVGSGSTFHSGLTGSADIAPYIPRSTNPNWIPDTAVRLTSGTTTLSWTNLYDVRPFLQVVPTGSSSGGGVITGSADSTYLRLDTTNDPLTGPLDIIPSLADVVGLNIETLGDASSIAVTQRGSGSGILTPAFSFTREPVGNSVVTFSESAIEVVDSSGNSGTIIGSALHYIKDAVTRMEINPNAQGTGTLALFDTAFTLSPYGLLLLLKNNGSSRFYVNASGTAYSNDVPLIKEAPVNGLPYVRRNAGWDVAITGSSSGGDGWNSLSAITFLSADSPSYVVYASSNITGTVGVGMKIQLTHQSVTKNFVVNYISLTGTTTYLNLYGGTDFTLNVTGAITNPKYSNAKSPFGFSTDPSKWTVTVTDSSDQTQSSPVTTTWYNLGSLSISIPVGTWNVNYKVLQRVAKAASTSTNMYSTLSTANNSESDLDFTTLETLGGASGSLVLVTTQVCIPKTISVSAKTIYYLNARTTLGADSIGHRGDVGTTVIRAVCPFI